MSREEKRSANGNIITSEELKDLWEFLHQLDTKVSTHMSMEEKIQPKIDEMVEVFNTAKGVLSFIKILAAIGGSIAAAVFWLKDHIKW